MARALTGGVSAKMGGIVFSQSVATVPVWRNRLLLPCPAHPLMPVQARPLPTHTGGNAAWGERRGLHGRPCLGNNAGAPDQRAFSRPVDCLLWEFCLVNCHQISFAVKTREFASCLDGPDGGWKVGKFHPRDRFFALLVFAERVAGLLRTAKNSPSWFHHKACLPALVVPSQWHPASQATRRGFPAIPAVVARRDESPELDAWETQDSWRVFPRTTWRARQNLSLMPELDAGTLPV